MPHIQCAQCRRPSRWYRPAAHATTPRKALPYAHSSPRPSPRCPLLMRPPRLHFVHGAALASIATYMEGKGFRCDYLIRHWEIATLTDILCPYSICVDRAATPVTRAPRAHIDLGLARWFQGHCTPTAPQLQLRTDGERRGVSCPRAHVVPETNSRNRRAALVWYHNARAGSRSAADF